MNKCALKFPNVLGNRTLNYSNHENRIKTRYTAECFDTLSIQAIAPQTATRGFLVRYGVLIRLTSTKCNYGGIRHWFLCPQCGKRVANLYGSSLHCRHCANAVNASSQAGKQARNLAQIWRTIGRYNIDADGFTRLREWHRPKRIHRKTWQRIIDKHNSRLTLNFRYLRRWLDNTDPEQMEIHTWSLTH